MTCRLSQRLAMEPSLLEHVKPSHMPLVKKYFHKYGTDFVTRSDAPFPKTFAWLLERRHFHRSQKASGSNPYSKNRPQKSHTKKSPRGLHGCRVCVSVCSFHVNTFQFFRASQLQNDDDDFQFPPSQTRPVCKWATIKSKSAI